MTPSSRSQHQKSNSSPPLPPLPHVDTVPFPSYSIEVTPPPYTEYDDYPDFTATHDAGSSSTTGTFRARRVSLDHSNRPLGRTQSAGATGSGVYIPFPEPQIYRSVRDDPPPQLTRTRSHSHLNSSFAVHPHESRTSFTSFASSYNQHVDSDHYGSGSEHSHDAEDLSRELSTLSLNAEESLIRFQAGGLPENDQAWHLLVPSEAQEALGKQEVQRQSVIFEIFKGEREYVSDLETVQEVFINGLRNAHPPIIPPEFIEAYVSRVFGNLDRILAQHKRMLKALFERQREQHPLIQSVADIILDAVLGTDFRSAYEDYIKHYPLSESYHRTEQKRNPAYRHFVQSVSSDPRIRKRDLITFLSRPVTRLPRLNLVLEQVLKLTDKEYDHPDLEILPIILGILGDFIKSTQPGIEAAESKVKFWALCESLVYQKGEIIDMDLYDDIRTLVYTGPLLRATRSDSSWATQPSELTGSLLDNYFLLTRDEKRPNAAVKRHLVSRPLPIAYLRLGSFTAPAELRKQKAEDGGFRDNFRSQTVTVYPFTIYHASNRFNRRYTFHVPSEGIRKRWHSFFVDTIGVYKVRSEANMLFYQKTLTDRFFRVAGTRVAYGPRAKFSGRVTSAVPFISGGRRFIAVGCESGIYVAPWASEDFRRVLPYSHPTGMAAIGTVGSKTFNKFIIHAGGSLLSYSLDAVAQVATGHNHVPNAIENTMERVTKDSSVAFFKHIRIGERQLIMYALKRRLQSSLDLYVVEVVHKAILSPQRTNQPSSRGSFRTFGDPGYVPRDAFDISPLLKTVGICSRDGIVIVDPIALASSKHLIVPDLSDAASNPPVYTLKSRIDDAKPLGLVPLPGQANVRDREILVVFDSIGCYVTRQGIPCRSAGFIKWETKADSFAQRGSHVFLFSPQFIEIRNIATGVIVQVIEAADIRLLHAGPTYGEDEDILVALRGSKDDQDGLSEKIVELLETSEIPAATPISTVPSVWDEWDM